MYAPETHQVFSPQDFFSSRPFLVRRELPAQKNLHSYPKPSKPMYRKGTFQGKKILSYPVKSNEIFERLTNNVPENMVISSSFREIYIARPLTKILCMPRKQTNKYFTRRLFSVKRPMSRRRKICSYHTLCPGSLDQIFTLTYYIKWVNISWRDRKHCKSMYRKEIFQGRNCAVTIPTLCAHFASVSSQTL